jgi:hypothetical protein
MNSEKILNSVYGLVFGVAILSVALYFFQKFVEASKVTARAMVLHHLGNGTMMTDGAEQKVFEYSRIEPFKLEGYIDLSNMKTGDEIIIRQYVKIKPDGELKKYWEEKYNGIQANPICYITPKPSIYGILITVQQTAGSYITFDWEFYMTG